MSSMTQVLTVALCGAYSYLRVINAHWLRVEERLLAGLIHRAALPPNELLDALSIKPSPRDGTASDTQVPVAQLASVELVPSAVRMARPPMPGTATAVFWFGEWTWLTALAPALIAACLSVGVLAACRRDDAVLYTCTTVASILLVAAVLSTCRSLAGAVWLMHAPARWSTQQLAAAVATFTVIFSVVWAVLSGQAGWLYFNADFARLHRLTAASATDLLITAGVDGQLVDGLVVSPLRLKVAISFLVAMYASLLVLPAWMRGSLHRQLRKQRSLPRFALLSPLLGWYWLYLVSMDYTEVFAKWQVLLPLTVRGSVAVLLLLVSLLQTLLFRAYLKVHLNGAEKRRHTLAKLPLSLKVGDYRNMIAQPYNRLCLVASEMWSLPVLQLLLALLQLTFSLSERWDAAGQLVMYFTWAHCVTVGVVSLLSVAAAAVHSTDNNNNNRAAQ